MGTGGASGTANSWAEYAATHHHEATVIGNFEAKNPNKYHHTGASASSVGSRMAGGYRGYSATDYVQQQQHQQQQQQSVAASGGHYGPTHSGGATAAGYGLYHPDGVQATPIQQSQSAAGAPGTHPGYDAYPHIVRNKYTSAVPSPGMHLPSSSRVDLMYNERSQRYVSGYGTGSGYMPSSGAVGNAGTAPGTGSSTHGTYYTQMGPTKSMMNPTMEYYGNSFTKQLQSSSHPHHHAATNPYIPPNRMAYASQSAASYHPHPSHPTHPHAHPHHHVPHPHHKSAVSGYGYTTSANGTVPASYEDPYHQRAMSGRVPLPHPYTTDPHHLQTGSGSYGVAPGSAGSYHHQVQTQMGYPNPKLTFSKNLNDFYTPNVTSGSVPQHYGGAPPTGLTHSSHYGMKYGAQPVVPSQKHAGVNGGATGVPTTMSQTSRKSSSSCYFDTPSPVIDINHPLIDLEEQINSVKILKSAFFFLLSLQMMVAPLFYLHFHVAFVR